MHSNSELYVGIDVGRDSLEVALLQQRDTSAFPNTAEGIAQLIVELTPRAPRLIAVEASGGYEQDVFRQLQTAGLPVALVKISDITNRIRKSTKSTCAISTETPAIPPNPITPAAKATIKNMSAQLSILASFLLLISQLR